ncbi:hypothetical protein EDB19DRAFT_1835552 [Suillus lakei]|nr:hypothetical protein EDB19DRAFT_1835552 [Suillus lakei]
MYTIRTFLLPCHPFLSPSGCLQSPATTPLHEIPPLLLPFTTRRRIYENGEALRKARSKSTSCSTNNSPGEPSHPNTSKAGGTAFFAPPLPPSSPPPSQMTLFSHPSPWSRLLRVTSLVEENSTGTLHNSSPSSYCSDSNWKDNRQRQDKWCTRAKEVRERSVLERKPHVSRCTSLCIAAASGRET